MSSTKRVLCWRCDGVGDLTDDDGRPRFCPTCMGMGFISIAAADGSAGIRDGWYEDPQPVRISDAD